jgi:hypothetical protein
MFAVGVSTFARGIEDDRRLFCRCRTAKKSNCNRERCAHHRDRSYHFVIAMWSAKEGNILPL